MTVPKKDGEDSQFLLSPSEAGKKGGKARANVLSADERSAIAKDAARARWSKLRDEIQNAEKPLALKEPIESGELHSLFRGTLRIGDLDLECHVLSDYRRIFTQREMVRILSAGRESGDLGSYLQANPLLNKDLILGTAIQFRIPGTQFVGNGYEATQLIEICDKFMEADERDLLTKSHQKKLAKQSQIVVRSCAKVGIITLIDEATGFQKFRAKRDLQIKLQAFIADELQDWARMFPDDFWLELARLEGIRYSPRNRPLRWGKYIMMFVYDAIDPDVGRELRSRNPNPRFLQNHHQWLKDFGRNKVHDQIERVVTIMKLCDSMEEFRAKFDRVFRKSPVMQYDLPWGEMVQTKTSSKPTKEKKQ